MSDIRTSEYAPILERVAPGIVELIETNQGSGEEWPGTLARLMNRLDCTPEQNEILTTQMRRAANGEPPALVPVVETAETSGVAKIALIGLLSWAIAGG